ncbi:uncharacterized protein isoform X2 [Rhodnius prolixus]|uniref:uncharacterized protein isoform X2 n=1 Tax=Rhodnius prolixus TaxID=13249 RepID=UPI003D187E29
MDDHLYSSSDTSRRKEIVSMEKEHLKPSSNKRNVVLGVVNTAGMKSTNVNRKRRWDQPPEELETSKKVCVESESVLKKEIESPSSLSDFNIDSTSELSTDSSGSAVKLSDSFSDNLAIKNNYLADYETSASDTTLKQLETGVSSSTAGISTTTRITPERMIPAIRNAICEESDPILADETIDINCSELSKDCDGDIVVLNVSPKTSSFNTSKNETRDTQAVETRTFVSSMSDSLKQIQFYDGGDSNSDSEDFDKLSEDDEPVNCSTHQDKDVSRVTEQDEKVENKTSTNDKICISEEESSNKFALKNMSNTDSIDTTLNSIVNSDSVNTIYKDNTSEVMQRLITSEEHSLIMDSDTEGLFTVQSETEVPKTLENNLERDVSIHSTAFESIYHNKNEKDLSAVKIFQVSEEFDFKASEESVNTSTKSIEPSSTTLPVVAEELIAIPSILEKADDPFYLEESSILTSNMDSCVVTNEITESKEDNKNSSKSDAGSGNEKNKIEGEVDYKQLELTSFSKQRRECNEEIKLKEKNVDRIKDKDDCFAAVLDISDESAGEASVAAKNSKELESSEKLEFVDSTKIFQEEVENEDILNKFNLIKDCVESVKESTSQGESILDIPLPISSCASSGKDTGLKIAFQNNNADSNPISAHKNSLKGIMEESSFAEPLVSKYLEEESTLSEEVEEKIGGVSVVSSVDIGESEVDISGESEQVEQSIEVSSATSIDPAVMEVIFGQNEKSTSGGNNEVMTFNTLASLDLDNGSDEEIRIEKHEAENLTEGKLASDFVSNALDSNQHQKSSSYVKLDSEIQIQDSEIILDSAEIVTVDPNKPLIEEIALISDTSNDSVAGPADCNLMTEIDNYIDSSELDKTSPFDVKSYKISSDESNDGESKTTYETAKTISDDQDKDDSDNVEVKRGPQAISDLSKEETEETMESVYFDANLKEEVSENEDPLEGSERSITGLFETHRLEEECQSEDFLSKEDETEQANVNEFCKMSTHNLNEEEVSAFEVQRELMDVFDKEDVQDKSLKIVSSVIDEMEINYERDVTVKSGDKEMSHLEGELEVEGKSLKFDIEVIAPHTMQVRKETLNEERKTFVLDGDSRYTIEIDEPQKSEIPNRIRNLNEEKTHSEIVVQEDQATRGEQRVCDDQVMEESQTIHLKQKNMDTPQDSDDEINKPEEMEISLAIGTIQGSEAVETAKETESIFLVPLAEDSLTTGSTLEVEKERVNKEVASQLREINTVKLECAGETNRVQDTLAVKSIIQQNDEEFIINKMDVDDNLELEATDLGQRIETMKKLEGGMEITSLTGEKEQEITIEQVGSSEKEKYPACGKDASYSQYEIDKNESVKMGESKNVENLIKTQITENILRVKSEALDVKVTEQDSIRDFSKERQGLKTCARKVKALKSDLEMHITSGSLESPSKIEDKDTYATKTLLLKEELLKKKDFNPKIDDIVTRKISSNFQTIVVTEKEGLEQKVLESLLMAVGAEKGDKRDIELSSKEDPRLSEPQDTLIMEKCTDIESDVEFKKKKDSFIRKAPVDSFSVPLELSTLGDSDALAELSETEDAGIMKDTPELKGEICGQEITEDLNKKENISILSEKTRHPFKEEDAEDSEIKKYQPENSSVMYEEPKLKHLTENDPECKKSKNKRELFLELPAANKLKELPKEKECLDEDGTSPKQTGTEEVNKVECLVESEVTVPPLATESVITENFNKIVDEMPEESISDDITESIRVKEGSEVVIETEVADLMSGDYSKETELVMDIDEPPEKVKQSQKDTANTKLEEGDRKVQRSKVTGENSNNIQIIEEVSTVSKSEKYQYYKDKKKEDVSVDGPSVTKRRKVICKEGIVGVSKLEKKGISLLSINVDQNLPTVGESGRDATVVPLLTTITGESQQKSQEGTKSVPSHSIVPGADEPQKQALSPLQKHEPITLRIYKDNLTVRTDGLDSPKKHRSPILAGELKTQLSPHLIKGSPSRSSLSPQNKQLEFTLKIAKDANTNFPKATMSPKSNISPSGSIWKTDASAPVISKETLSPNHGSPPSETTLNKLKLKICKPSETVEVIGQGNLEYSGNSLETKPTITLNYSDSSTSENSRTKQCSQMDEFRTPKSHLKLETMFKKMLETQESMALSSSSVVQIAAAQSDPEVVGVEETPQPPPPVPLIPTPRKRGRPRKIVPTMPRIPGDPNNPLQHSFTVPDTSSALADGGANSNRPMRSCRGRTKPIVTGTRKPRGGGMMRGGGRGRGVLRITPDRETLTEYEKAELAKIEERKERLRAESIARYEAKKAKKLAKKLKDEERRKRLARERAEKAEAAAPQVFEEETRMSASDSYRGLLSAFRTNPEAGGEESQNSISNTPSSGLNKRGRMEIPLDFEGKEIRVDQLAEYYWQGTELSMIQEQVSLYLGVKSFKRKYPCLNRRSVEAEERTFLEDSGLVPKSMCDLGLTAVSSAEVLDIMFHDFPDKYEEFRKYVREKQAQEVSCKQKALASLRRDGSKIEPREQALEAVAAWNANLNRERKEERRCALDLQTFTIHYPKSDRESMTRPVPKVGLYPIALIPGQFCDYYKQYTPTELMYFPLNTVLYGPLKPNQRHQGNGSDDGSGTDSDTSSSDESSDSSSESSDTSDEQEEAKCKICKTVKRDGKDAQMEPLIQCAQCKTTTHPSCQDFTDEMLPHIKKYNWLCTDCKQCLTCKTRGNVEKILCCDLCDRGHHVECLGLKKVPERWHCSVCSYCSNCGTRDPGGPDWQHEYKKDEKGMKVYKRTLCASCCKNALM